MTANNNNKDIYMYVNHTVFKANTIVTEYMYVKHAVFKTNTIVTVCNIFLSLHSPFYFCEVLMYTVLEYSV